MTTACTLQHYPSPHSPHSRHPTQAVHATTKPSKPLCSPLTEAAALSLVLALLGAGPPQHPSLDPLQLRRQVRTLARSSATLRTQLLLLAYRHAALQAEHARCLPAEGLSVTESGAGMAEDEERMAALVERLERGLLSLSSDNTQLKVCLWCGKLVAVW